MCHKLFVDDAIVVAAGIVKLLIMRSITCTFIIIIVCVAINNDLILLPIFPC